MEGLTVAHGVDDGLHDGVDVVEALDLLHVRRPGVARDAAQLHRVQQRACNVRMRVRTHSVITSGVLTGADSGFWSGGPSGVLTPRGPQAQNLLKIGGFPQNGLKTA